ncbi:MAG TPA: hypothetical protein PLN48_12930 [Lachnospiraceae bacterium]|nr:hypothetical protein [Lachnospiraceae bacterium]
MKSLQKASFTIEMALIMPVILLVVFSGIYLMAHVRNRAFLTASACEQAVSGHDPETPALFAAVDPARSKEDSEERRTVSFKAGTIYFSGQALWDIKAEGTYEKIKPVTFIRKFLAARQLVEPQDGLD